MNTWIGIHVLSIVKFSEDHMRIPGNYLVGGREGQVNELHLISIQFCFPISHFFRVISLILIRSSNKIHRILPYHFEL